MLVSEHHLLDDGHHALGPATTASGTWRRCRQGAIKAPGVARARVIGSSLSGRLPGSRATAGGTWRRCRQGAIEAPSLPELRGRLWR